MGNAVPFLSSKEEVKVPPNEPSAQRVLVTGAGGKLGSLVFKKLLESPQYQVLGLVRTDKSAQKLRSLGAQDEHLIIGDVTRPETLGAAFKGCHAVILCTSSVPRVSWTGIPGAIGAKLQGGSPLAHALCFDDSGSPKEVDYVGGKNQIEAAQAAGVKRFIYVGSMGGTKPEHFLNDIGRKPDGTGGAILTWKRLAEEKLIKSGLNYTIIHPGGLQDKAGGRRELVLGVDDKIMETDAKMIPREDVAELCVQALNLAEAERRSIDVGSKPEGEGDPTKDFAALFKTVERQNCNYQIKFEEHQQQMRISESAPVS